ncbi:hypothetical protein RB195_012541 [Necator americanus]|uniref:Uncharacterized protein n=1 Tax=Necator americanus TaxID=51031 RepID=A0ABR1DRE5_NECAM
MGDDDENAGRRAEACGKTGRAADQSSLYVCRRRVEKSADSKEFATATTYIHIAATSSRIIRKTEQQKRFTVRATCTKLMPLEACGRKDGRIRGKVKIGPGPLAQAEATAVDSLRNGLVLAPPKAKATSEDSSLDRDSESEELGESRGGPVHATRTPCPCRSEQMITEFKKAVDRLSLKRSSDKRGEVPQAPNHGINF